MATKCALTRLLGRMASCYLRRITTRSQPHHRLRRRSRGPLMVVASPSPTLATSTTTTVRAHLCVFLIACLSVRLHVLVYVLVCMSLSASPSHPLSACRNLLVALILTGLEKVKLSTWFLNQFLIFKKRMLLLGK